MASMPKEAAVDMDYYVVFDPSDDSGLLYRWYGGQTVNIFDSDSGEEIDVYTIGEPQGPSLEDVRDSVSEHHEAVLKEMNDDGTDPDDPDQTDTQDMQDDTPSKRPNGADWGTNT